jgi:uncharacterized protein
MREPPTTTPRQPASSADHALYFGEVMHERLRPVHHRFTYRVFSILVDVDRLADLGRRLTLFSHNRFNLYSLYDRDHGNFDGGPLRPHIETLLREAGRTIPPTRIDLLCYPRILGFVFNPLSIYYCYEANGEIGAIIYEVRNTFGEHHAYVAPVEPGQAGDAGVRQHADKRFYVSPFIAMAAGYRFTLRRPGERIHVLIRETIGDEPLLTAAFTGRRRDFTDRQLLVALMRFPLMTLKVVAAINYEALRLWAKGVGFVDRQRAPEPPGTDAGYPVGGEAKTPPREVAK